jgi:hypothetical protein
MFRGHKRIGLRNTFESFGELMKRLKGFWFDKFVQRKLDHVEIRNTTDTLFWEKPTQYIRLRM